MKGYFKYLSEEKQYRVPIHPPNKLCGSLGTRLIEKIPVGERTKDQHQEMIMKCGGVREYLLSMGAFKE